MMKRYDRSKISDVKNRKIFFDTNILLYLFWPTNTWYERVYAGVFSNLLKQKNELVVDYVVISECINRAHRVEYDNYLNLKSLKRCEFNYKKYRNTAEGK